MLRSSERGDVEHAYLVRFAGGSLAVVADVSSILAGRLSCDECCRNETAELLFTGGEQVVDEVLKLALRGSPSWR